MRLRDGSETQTWQLDEVASLTFRPATSLDQDIATAIAAGYGKLILSSEAEALMDFGMSAPDQGALLATLAANIDDFTAYANHFYAVALGERLITKFEGFVDHATGEDLTLTRASLSRLFKDPALQAEWLKKASAALHEVRAAGNA